MTQAFLLRILAAALLGGVIGIERGFRAKEAGFRTHFLVALGAALFMILSAHGFDDVALSENMRLDVSRIAAQVVSGIGFIGAGTIIFQRQAVHGLTTAAGLWVTAAIGMAAGAGLYIIATAATLLVLLGLEVLNSLLPHLGHRNIVVTFTAMGEQPVRTFLDHLKADGVVVVSYATTDTAKNTSGETAHLEGSALLRNVRIELRPLRSRYADHLLAFLTSLEGVNLSSIE